QALLSSSALPGQSPQLAAPFVAAAPAPRMPALPDVPPEPGGEGAPLAIARTTLLHAVPPELNRLPPHPMPSSAARRPTRAAKPSRGGRPFFFVPLSSVPTPPLGGGGRGGLYSSLL